MRLSSRPVLWFLVFTYALTAVGQGVHLYVVHRLLAGAAAGTPIGDSPVRAWMPYGFYVTNVGPSLVALLMTLYLYGLRGVRRLLLRLAPWSVGRSWPVLAVCLFLPLAVAVLPLTILAALGVSDAPRPWQFSEYLWGAAVSGGLIGPGLCEEIGWRGFALPHLQRRYSALVSSLVIGVAWAFWHWPNYIFSSDPSRWWQFAALFPVSMALCILYTWAYNSTGGSLFVVVVLHGATVAVPSLSPSPDSAVWTLQTLAVASLYPIIAIGLVWRYGAANLSWRDRVVAGSPNQALRPTPGA